MSKALVIAILWLAAVVASAAWAQAPAKDQTTAIQGTWIATEGPKGFFRGRWSAEVLSKTPDAGHGTWALVNNQEQAVLKGTWSAKKLRGEWSGTWSARVAGGKSFSGTWAADIKDGETFEDMLKGTIERQVNGAWRSGRMQGNWSLQGAP